MLLVYCDTCGFRISQEDLDRGTVSQIDENRYLCSKCNPAQQAQQRVTTQLETQVVRQTPNEIKVQRTTPSPEMKVQRITPPTASNPRQPVSPMESRGGTGAIRPPTTSRKMPKEKALPMPMMAGLGAASALLILWLIWPSPKAPPVADPRAEKTELRTEPVRPLPAQPLAIVNPPPSTTSAQTPPDRVMPSWMQKTTRTEESGPRRANNEAQRDDGESTIFFDDALPPKAEENGTANVRFISWKWIPRPGPVFSGDFSHTMSGEVAEKVHQHYFENAAPPLMLTDQDILFAYVYIDPATPPKTIMMQWNEKGNWGHRAYWGENRMPFGTDNTPDQHPMGALPKFGEWVRLEVPASVVGFTGNAIAIAGCSFDQFGGRVYWDKVGVLRKSPKPAAAASAPVAPPVGMPTLAPEGQISLGKLPWNALSGGREYHNFFNKVKSSKAIWAKPTPMNELAGTFNVADGKYTGGTLIITSLRHERKDACRMALELNSKIVFDGVDSTPATEWSEQRYPVPTGVIKSGPNSLRVLNMEENGVVNASPWLMIHSIELFAEVAK